MAKRGLRGPRLCHACLKADADQRDRWAKDFADRRNYVAAQKEAVVADEYRAQIAISVNQTCSFHTPKPRQRVVVPEPSRRVPGLLEMEGPTS